MTVATADTEQISFTAFGVPMEVVVPARLRSRAVALTPPGAIPGLTDRTEACRVAVEQQLGRLRIVVHGTTIGTTADEDLALRMLDAQLHAQVALRAPEHIFVRAGVVAVGDRAVLLPGSRFAGKTTLTRALVAAGAVYYSDEFAVLDGHGLVHPYPGESPVPGIGSRRVPVAQVAVTSYRPGVTLDRQPLPPGAAVVALLGHTVAARARPREAMATLKAALARATAWTGDRGEAVDAARAIMESLS